ncbi:MAG TPA: hypothetical protein VGM10_06320 [Actinocrinis sp.]|jgi:hypothetical protein
MIISFRIRHAAALTAAALALSFGAFAAPAQAHSTTPLAPAAGAASALRPSTAELTLDATPAGLAPNDTSPDWRTVCASARYTATVLDTGIHIRSEPNGTILYGIDKGFAFTSSPYCVTSVPVAGQYWVYGNSVDRPSHVGWVGCTYLYGDCPGT